MSAKVLTKADAEAAKLPIIEGDKGKQAVHDVVVAIQAARRMGTACTKTKREVNLTGAKPWRQKGTGRARAGYASSVVWDGGGVVFGPKPRDYSKNVNKKVRKLAFTKALSERVLAGDVFVAPDFSVPSAKTKDFVAAVTSIYGDDDRVLVIGKGFDEKTLLAGRNVKPTLLASSREVNVEQLLRFKKIIVTEAALADLAERTAAPSESN
jgi:large subunit ribosomal protein L4